eukprot:6200905-Pleurochrysis_carterae.AAC.1
MVAFQLMWMKHEGTHTKNVQPAKLRRTSRRPHTLAVGCRRHDAAQQRLRPAAQPAAACAVPGAAGM